VWTAYAVLLLRFGVLAAIAAVYTADLLLGPSPLYAGDAWTGSTAFVVIPVLLALAVLAYRNATAGHRRRLEAAVAGEPPAG
jgi:hypothetical protein